MLEELTKADQTRVHEMVDRRLSAIEAAIEEYLIREEAPWGAPPEAVLRALAYLAEAPPGDLNTRLIAVFRKAYLESAFGGSEQLSPEQLKRAESYIDNMFVDIPWGLKARDAAASLWDRDGAYLQRFAAGPKSDDAPDPAERAARGSELRPLVDVPGYLSIDATLGLVALRYRLNPSEEVPDRFFWAYDVSADEARRAFTRWAYEVSFDEVRRFFFRHLGPEQTASFLVRCALAGGESFNNLRLLTPDAVPHALAAIKKNINPNDEALPWWFSSTHWASSRSTTPKRTLNLFEDLYPLKDFSQRVCNWLADLEAFEPFVEAAESLLDELGHSPIGTNDKRPALWALRPAAFAISRMAPVISRMTPVIGYESGKAYIPRLRRVEAWLNEIWPNWSGVPTADVIQYPTRTDWGSTSVSVALSPNGQRLASASGDRTVRLWSLPDGRWLNSVEDATDRRPPIVFSPGGDLLAIGSGSVVDLQQVADWKLLKTLEGHTGTVVGLVFSGDGRVLASEADTTVRLWGVA